VGHLQVFLLYSSTTALHVHSPLLVQSRPQYMSMHLLMFSIEREQRFEPSTSRIRIKMVTASPTARSHIKWDAIGSV
jgi:hypothetical protein